MLVSTVEHKGVRFRWHSFGADLIAEMKRNKLVLHQVLRRPVEQGVLEEYLVRIPNDSEEFVRAMTELYLVGYGMDDRNPKVSKAIKEWGSSRHQSN